MKNKFLVDRIRIVGVFARPNSRKLEAFSAGTLSNIVGASV